MPSVLVDDILCAVFPPRCFLINYQSSKIETISNIQMGEEYKSLIFCCTGTIVLKFSFARDMHHISNSLSREMGFIWDFFP